MIILSLLVATATTQPASSGSAIFGTVMAGVTVFVVGQIILKGFIEPIQDQRRVRGKVANALHFFRNYMPKDRLTVDGVSRTVGKDRDEINKAVAEIRNLGSELRQCRELIPLNCVWAAIRLVPNDKDIDKASQNLVGLSNLLHDPDAENLKADCCRNIAEALRIRWIEKASGQN